LKIALFTGNPSQGYTERHLPYGIKQGYQPVCHLTQVKALHLNSSQMKGLVFGYMQSVTHSDSNYHRLNGSSSPVLTATSLSYGKAKNSTPHRIKTPDLIEIKFDTVDYVGEMTPHAKFHVNPSKGGFPANG